MADAGFPFTKVLPDSLYNNLCRPQLTFKKEVTDQTKMLLDGQQWTACVDHVIMAW